MLVKSVMLLLIGALTSPFVYSQRNLLTSGGYVVIKSDTLKGEIKSSRGGDLYSSCLFRSNSQSEFKKYSAQDIDLFFVEGLGTFKSYPKVTFKSKKGAITKAHFLQILEGNRPVLLKTQDESNKIRFFMQVDTVLSELRTVVQVEPDENYTVMRKTINKYETDLRNAFADCPVKMPDLRERDLQKAFYLYHVCKDAKYKSRYVRPSRVRVGLTSALFFNQLTLKSLYVHLNVPGGYLDLWKFKRVELNSRSVSLGISTEFQLGNNAHWSFVNNIRFVSHEFQNADLFLNVKKIEIPFMIKYKTGLGHATRPTFGFGYAVPLNINSTFNSAPQSVLDANGHSTSLKRSPFGMGDIEMKRLAMCGFVGLDFAFERTTMELQYRIESVKLSNSWVHTKMTTNNVVLSFSIPAGSRK